ncbi:glycoside hydrolase [Streptomyces sp. SP2-10]|uniref:glycoside hydrolase n=1 Tax=Streptomyces sp. SP2-10 TaxID=2873385 RepID=UPI001CA719F0|nr:glycoside hydrolase [Streptomyces sp. SP2-10]MBY8844462.1 glycoside hydrolase [Streptomyces sp. SP2-10]
MRTRKIRKTRKKIIALSGALTVVGVVGTATAFGTGTHSRPHVEVHGGRVTVPVAGGHAVVDTADLAVRAQADDGRTWQLSAPAADGPVPAGPVPAVPSGLGPAGKVTVHGAKATWRYPAKGLTVTATARDGRLAVSVRSARQATLTWPVTGADPATREVQIPRGEGLSVPVADRWWNSAGAGLAGSEAGMADGLTMPFWGTSLTGRHGASYIAESDIGTTLRFVSTGGRLHTAAEHAFSPREDTTDYRITFALTDGSPVAAARDYRAWLTAHGGITTLRRKIARNPEVGKLIGAFHAYTWGQARTAEGVRRLRRLGIDRMWLGYDADGSPMDAEATKTAERSGYLVGPYDSWANAQDPDSADTPVSKWPAPVWQDACVHTADGKPVTGFGGRGCYVSSEALRRAETSRHHLADRTREMTANGADSYFLDVDAAGELFTDHTPTHPMTKAQDRRNRLERMARLSGDRSLVLGSESAGSWANGVLSFSHGSGTPVTDRLWRLERDRTTWGGYAPAGAPAIFFKPVRLPDDIAKAMYDPRYRVPLYQTVLHDSVISTERWELPWSKLPDQSRTRALLAMLYNVPLNLVLDQSELDRHGRQIARLQQYFAPLHKAAATEPMTDFRLLTPDRLVQRTTFGDGALTVTANFSAASHDGLPGGCVSAVVRSGTARQLCPAGL